MHNQNWASLLMCSSLVVREAVRLNESRPLILCASTVANDHFRKGPIVERRASCAIYGYGARARNVPYDLKARAAIKCRDAICIRNIFHVARYGGRATLY